MDLRIELKNAGIGDAAASRRNEAQEALDKLWTGELDFTGWVRDPLEFNESKVAEVAAAASEICGKCDYFIVLGVGGSFMGAKAVIDMLKPSDSSTEVLFAGYNFSGRYLKELTEMIAGHAPARIRHHRRCYHSCSGSCGICDDTLYEKEDKAGSRCIRQDPRFQTVHSDSGDR